MHHMKIILTPVNDIFIIYIVQRKKKLSLHFIEYLCIHIESIYNFKYHGIKSDIKKPSKLALWQIEYKYESLYYI